VYQRGATLAERVVLRGGLLVAMHPPPRHDATFLGGRFWDPSGITAHHGSWWDMSWTRRLVASANAHSVTFALCSAPGGPDAGMYEQGYDTMAFSPELEPLMGNLSLAICTHPHGQHRYPLIRLGGQNRPARIPRGLAVQLCQALSTLLEPPSSTLPPAPSQPRLGPHVLGVPLFDA
jgi:hypothetical protein